MLKLKDLVENIVNHRFDDDDEENIMSVARYYNVLSYLKKRAIRDDQKAEMVKAEAFKEKFADFKADDVKKALGRKWKKNAWNLKAFADSVKWRFDYSYVEPISTHEDGLIIRFGSDKNVSNMIKSSMKIGLFNRVSDVCSYVDRLSYDYSYNHNIYEILRQIVDDIIDSDNSNNSELDKTQINKLYHMGELFAENAHGRLNGVKVGSSFSGIRLNGISDEQIFEVLDEKYRQVPYYRNVANELNKKLNDEEKIMFDWHIERKARKLSEEKKDEYKAKGKEQNQMLKKIGIRACSKMTNYKKRMHAYDSLTYKGAYREDYLDETFGKGNWTEFDFKSSIWQLTYFLNKGIWLNNETDLYNEIYKAVIDKDGFKTKKERDMFKLFGNVIYFDNPKMQGIHTLDKIRGLRTWLAKYYGFNVVKDDYQDYKAELETVNYRFEQIRQGIDEVIGKLYGSEIFVHESCVYMELYKRLCDKGIEIKQVFDGFYMNKESYEYVKDYVRDNMQNILEDYAIKYVNKKVITD